MNQSSHRSDITLQIATDYPNLPTEEIMAHWCNAVNALLDRPQSELTIRFVDEEEIATLNKNYRNKDAPTNVLSFPFELPVPIPDLEYFLGDIIICPSVIERESIAQEKSFLNHLTHITIHGMLHLLGYDHIEEGEAEIMENLERAILAKLNIHDPYLLPEERD